MNAMNESAHGPMQKDADRQQLRANLLVGLASSPGAKVDADYFQRLRHNVRQHRISRERT